MGPSAPSYTTVTRWPKRFRQGREDISDDHRRAASSLSQFTGENIQLIRRVTSNDPHSTYGVILSDTSLSHRTRE